MVSSLKINRETDMPELAALERRGGERSEPPRSGRAANSGRPGSAANPEVSHKAQRRKFTGEYKLSIVEEADRITDAGEIGALLRREGLYSSHLVGWRRLRGTGALGALSSKRGRKSTANPLLEENQKLKSQVVRLEKKLLQAETIIDVQKKLSILLGIALPETVREESTS